MSKQVRFLGQELQFLTPTLQIGNGLQLFCYQAGTTTKANTYPSATSNSANTNPLVCTSSGHIASNGTPVDVYINQSMKFVLAPANDTDPPTSPYWTIDNITATQELWTTQVKTANYQTVDSDRDSLILVDTTSGSVTISLEASASAGNGFGLAIQKIDNTTNTVTIQGHSSETINGSNTFVLAQQYQGALLRCTGTGWYTQDGVPTVLYDTNGFTALTTSATSSAVNGLTIVDSATTYPVTFKAIGSDTNIGLNIQGKGTGEVNLGTSGVNIIQINDGNSGITINSGADPTTINGSSIVLDSNQPLTDLNKVNILSFAPAVSSAVNYVELSNAATGSSPYFAAQGSDTNVGIGVLLQGSGSFIITGGTTTTVPVIWGISGSSGQVEHNTSNTTATRTVTWPDSNIPHWTIQTVVAQTQGAIQDTNHLAFGTSVPTSSAGTQVFSLAITPQSTTNTLIIEGVVTIGCDGSHSDQASLALFDGGSSAIACWTGWLQAGANPSTIPFYYKMAAGTTSQLTFTLRFGCTANTSYVNAVNNTDTQGGTLTSMIKITETA
jgi:hypothetical protein